jgi:hypothetical protein
VTAAGQLVNVAVWRGTGDRDESGGRFTDAEALGREASEIARRAGQHAATELAYGFLVTLAPQTGDTDLAPDAEYVARAMDRGDGAVVACWQLALGQPAKALRIYRTLPAPESMAVSVPRFTFSDGAGGHRTARGRVRRPLSARNALSGEES